MFFCELTRKEDVVRSVVRLQCLFQLKFLKKALKNKGEFFLFLKIDFVLNLEGSVLKFAVFHFEVIFFVGKEKNKLGGITLGATYSQP